MAAAVGPATTAAGVAVAASSKTYYGPSVNMRYGPVAVAIRARQVADIEESPAPDVEERALALVGAEGVALVDDVPGVGDPELAQGLVDRAGCRHRGSAIEGL